VHAQLADGLSRGIFPGAVAAVVRGRTWLALEAAGYAQVRPRRRPIAVDTIFDLASLTKPLATTTAILQLCARGLSELDAPVASYLPLFAQGGKAAATVRQLLTHTSGLPAWEMLYLPGARRPDGSRPPACDSIGDAVARICATPVTADPGAKVEYSDLGFILLGYLVSLLSGEPLDAYTHRHLTRPLGLQWMRFTPPASWRSRCAATELGNAYERARAAEQGIGRSFRWRTRLLRGEVHDGNAYYLGGGVAGHAGLFGTAADVARVGTILLHSGTSRGQNILPPALIAEATRDQTSRLNPGGRGLGWAVAQDWFGRRASGAAFGHTGFTGTSVLIDPARDVVIVLLTNRVHPVADSMAIAEFRPQFHDAVLEALDR
jgi:CubicO group peptidase (beta-lactamase class C family)